MYPRPITHMHHGLHQLEQKYPHVMESTEVLRLRACKLMHAPADASDTDLCLLEHDEHDGSRL